MHSFEEIVKSKCLLGLHERATLKEVKLKYKNLMKKWHPDKHKDNLDQANKMSIQINEAYKIILDYCKDYRYSFEEKDIKRNNFSTQEWWDDKFSRI